VICHKDGSPGRFTCTHTQQDISSNIPTDGIANRLYDTIDGMPSLEIFKNDRNLDAAQINLRNA